MSRRGQIPPPLEKYLEGLEANFQKTEKPNPKKLEKRIKFSWRGEYGLILDRTLYKAIRKIQKRITKKAKC